MRFLRSLFLLVIALVIPSTIASAEETSISPDISKMDAIELFSETELINNNELVVKFKDSVSSKEKQRILAKYKSLEISLIEKENISLIQVKNNINLESLAKKLIKLKEIEFVEPNYTIESEYTPKDSGYKKQWYLKKIQMPKAWDTSKGSSKITVAVVDTGVQRNHPELSKKLVKPYNAVTGGSSYPADDHGTHVAGIIGASINKKGIAGIAPNVKIMPINVFSDSTTDAYSVARGIYYAVDNGANIINMSLGSSYYSFSLDYAVQYAASNGVLMVAAAGNSATYMPSYPAAYSNVLGVSATDKRDMRTSFSNYGNYIDIAAPGLSIYSTITNSKYQNMSGTSMASPVVSGVAALILSKNPLLSPAQVENILIKSAKDIGSDGWDYYYGYGRVDASKALKRTPAPLSKIKTNVSTFNMEGKNKVKVSFTITKGKKVTLYVKDSKGQTVKTLLKNRTWNSSKFSYSWDGKDKNGVYVGSGSYKIVAKVSNGKESVTKTKTLKIKDKIVPSVSISSKTVTFSPKAQGKTSISLSVNKKAKVTAKVYDTKGKLVKKIWSNKKRSGGKYNLKWDGKNSKGKKVKDGTYKLKISIVDYSKKKGKTRTKSIKVDTKVPYGKVTVGKTFKMNGTSTIPAKIKVKETVKVTAYIKSSSNKTIKKIVSEKSYKKGTHTISWNGKDGKNNFVTEGKYYYYFVVKDASGNRKIVKSSQFTTQDWKKPTISSQTTLTYNKSGNIDIPYSLSKPGKVTIEIYSGPKLVRTVLKDSSQGLGNKKVVWNGKDSAGKTLTDGTYQVKMKVVDKYNQSASYTSSLKVTLTKITIDSPTVVWKDNDVFYKISQAGKVTVDIYNEYNEKVRTVYRDKSLGAGIQSFYWDGLNDDGYYETDYYYYSVPYTFVISVTNSAGTKSTAKGTIDNEVNPTWLKDHSYSFSSADGYSNNKLTLSISTNKAAKVTLYTYDGEFYYDYGYDPIDRKEFILKSGDNTLIYTKPTLDELYYRLNYKDHLGNEYGYYFQEGYSYYTYKNTNGPYPILKATEPNVRK